jgi:DNA mismatch repair protein MutS2
LAREAELKRLEKDAEREGRRQARAYLMEARQRVEEALGAARGAADEEAAREARRLVEEGIREEGEGLAGQRGSGAAGQSDHAEGITPGSRVRLESGGTGEVAEIRPDGKAVVFLGAMRVIADLSGLALVSRREERKHRVEAAPLLSGPAAPLEIDLRGMTGDEAETATVAAVDAAVLAEQPLLRIIHGMGTGVVRERVQRVVARDRRISRYSFAPRNQGGTGVTIVEFSA